jgi:hypothetical protein
MVSEPARNIPVSERYGTQQPHAMMKRNFPVVIDVQRENGADDRIALVGAVDSILHAQAKADTNYFLGMCTRMFSRSVAG